MEYLLKASAVIAIFYVLYFLFLRNETFFKTNRFFLLSGLFLAVILPIIAIPIYVEYTPVTIEYTPVDVSGFTTEHSALPELLPAKQRDSGLALMDYILLFYLVGVAAFLVRFIIQLVSLAKIIAKHKSERNGKYIHVINDEITPPFSFFNWIVYNPKQFSPLELEQIITHEKVHVNQRHSIDILVAQLASILLWFNPFIHLYAKSLKQNLEFLADNNALTILKSKKAYQYTLLKTCATNHQLALSNNFYNSFIKKRIVMLQKSKSKKINRIKYLLVLPALGWFLMSFNTKEVFVEKENTQPVASDAISQFEIESTFTDEDFITFKDELAEKGFNFELKSLQRKQDNLVSSIYFTITKNGAEGSYRNGGGMASETVVIQYFEKKNKFVINTQSFINAQKDLGKTVQIRIDKTTTIADIEAKKKLLKDNYNIDLKFEVVEKDENDKIESYSIKLGKGKISKGITTNIDKPLVFNYYPKMNELTHYSINKNGDPTYGGTFVLESRKSYLISNNYDDKSLKYVVKRLKKNGIEITFKDVKRNENDTIIGISISAVSKNGRKLNYQQHNGTPITPIAVSYFENGKLSSTGPSTFSRESFKSANKNKKSKKKPTDKQRKTSNSKQKSPWKLAIGRQSSNIQYSKSLKNKKVTEYALNSSISYSPNEKNTKNAFSRLNDLELNNQKEFTISGVVKDINGTTLPRTNIIVKNSKKGAISDFDGKYKIKVKENDELVFSYIGFNVKVIKVQADQPILNVILNEQEVSTSEKQKKDALSKTSITTIDLYDGKKPVYLVNGTAISKEEFNEVDTEQINSVTIMKENEAQSIFGDKAKDDVIIIQKKENSEIDEDIIIIDIGENNSNIKIRDTGKNKPLIVIDGKERKRRLKNINTNDIEKINVLKDKSAIDKYGEKGKNGVIEITTKKKK
ncbi:M56 family metallopeptidase [Hyunsoonleella sp. 2307UL5-6]|uniref:M56 family metallopeptidase n=1 Tax=Hyunsoonleella sp. 2307UL5-6 TaxID=3384768 RepID=UPI0039BD0A91